jgi:hypothetical protein
MKILLAFFLEISYIYRTMRIAHHRFASFLLRAAVFAAVFTGLFAESAFAQRATATDDRMARKQFEEDQRLDEYANSLRRRDWLKDRLILQLGIGSRFPMMGESGLGFGAGAEYITRWHLSLWGAGGYVPTIEDPVGMTDKQGRTIMLNAGMGWRVGMGYHLFPKSPMHMSILASYGTVWYDHDKRYDADGVSEMIVGTGWELDLALTYLTDQWYYLQILVGFYYIGDKMPGTSNDTWMWDDIKQETVSRVVNENGIPNYGIVFGINIGFSFPEFFPDDTEVRRREREKKYDGASSRSADRPSSRSKASSRSRNWDDD